MCSTRRNRTAKMEFCRPEPAALSLLLIASLSLAGCRLFGDADELPDARLLLPPAKSSPESVTIEVRLVLVPDQRLARLDEIWRHADEQIIDSQIRRELARNGFRAGVIGPALPAGLAELLQLDAPMEGGTATPGEESTWQSVPLDRHVTVTGHRLQLRPHKRIEIQSSPVHDAAPLLFATDAGPVGNAYELVQGIYALQWSPQSPGRIEAELTPELHHGMPKNQYTVGAGHDILPSVGKQREVFEQLRVRAPLSAGQMLLISGDREGSGSLGHFFHTVPANEGDQHKLVLVRLAQVLQQP